MSVSVFRLRQQAATRERRTAFLGERYAADRPVEGLERERQGDSGLCQLRRQGPVFPQIRRRLAQDLGAIERRYLSPSLEADLRGR